MIRLIECECHAEERETETDAKVKRLEDAGFTVSRADRDDMIDGRISSSGIRRSSFGLGERYVSFDGVATSEDSYGQASCVARSNYIAIKRDYPDFPWVDASYVNTNALGCFVADMDDDMIDLFTGLAEDYPVYDEGEHSRIESEEIHESWGDWLSSDIYRELDRLRQTTGTLQTMWDDLGDEAVTDLWWTCASQDVFGSYPEHTGVEVTWGRTDELAKAFVPYLTAAYWAKRTGRDTEMHVWVVRLADRIRNRT